MNFEEFRAKWFANKHDMRLFGNLIEIFDFLYLNYTKEQVLEILSEYYDNADDIKNDLINRLEDRLNILNTLK